MMEAENLETMDAGESGTLRPNTDEQKTMTEEVSGGKTVLKRYSFGQRTSSSSVHSSPVTGRSRLCNSPVTAIVGNALNRLNLKRSSSAPMINQIGSEKPTTGALSSSFTAKSSNDSNNGMEIVETKATIHNVNNNNSNKKDLLNASHVASSFLSSLEGPRPRRFSASFSPGSPGPTSSRIQRLRQQETTDWEAHSEKEFNGSMTIAQTWEDLSLESMSMEGGNVRRTSLSDQLWLTMPAVSSASSSPAASPKIISRFSPSMSSPSPTRKSFTTTSRSLSPIAVRPSVLNFSGVMQGVKRKHDWDNQMDCSQHPPKRLQGLLSTNNCGNGSNRSSPVPVPLAQGGNGDRNSNLFHIPISSGNGLNTPPIHSSLNNSSSHQQNLIGNVEDSPSSIETDRESSVSSNCGIDSPFFHPVDSPIQGSSATSEEFVRPVPSKISQ